MMTRAAAPEARLSAARPQPTNCSQKREQRGLPVEMSRMMGLQTAYELLGRKKALADALGIGVRSLNHKLSAERGVSDVDLFVTAKTLETRSAKMLKHAAKLRAVLDNTQIEARR